MFNRLLNLARPSGGTKFSVVRRGYDPAEVHAYLEDIAAACALGTPIDTALIENRTFRVVKRGYDRVEVHKFPDDFLKKVYELSTETMDETGRHDDLATRIHKSYFDYRDTVAEYAAVSSSAYLEARNTALALNKVSKYDD